MDHLTSKDRRLSRRQLLRGALVGGAGLVGASMFGCDDGDSNGADATASGPTSTPEFNVTVAAPDMSWTSITGADLVPPARYDHTLVTDGNRLYLFGGRTPDVLNDLWTYDIAANNWMQAGGSGPSARFGHNSIWDATRNKVMVFGGQAGQTFFDDVWEFDPAQGLWTPVSQGVGPAPRYGAAACLDDTGHMLITHGFTSEGRFDDTWQFELATAAWSELPTPVDDRPSKRCLIDGVWDERKRRLLLYGGQSDEAAYMDDLWGWSPEIGWQQIARTPRPSPRNLYSMVYDVDRTVAIIIGGRTDQGPTSDVWVYSSDGESWSQGAPEGEAFTNRYGHDAAIAPDGSIYLFGGNDGSDALNDLWRLERT